MHEAGFRQRFKRGEIRAVVHFNPRRQEEYGELFLIPANQQEEGLMETMRRMVPDLDKLTYMVVSRPNSAAPSKILKFNHAINIRYKNARHKDFVSKLLEQLEKGGAQIETRHYANSRPGQNM